MSSAFCPGCGHENDPSASSCKGCGQPLRPAPGERRCPACGSPIEPRFRFCGNCGLSLVELRPVPTSGPAIPTPPPTLERTARGSAHDAPEAPDPRPAATRRVLRLVPMRQDGLASGPHALSPDGTVCGRAHGQLRFSDDMTVSPEHARFSLRPEGWFVEDLGSLNGTFVRLRAPRPLVGGDEIRLGRQVLRVDPIPRLSDPLGARPWGSPDPGYRARLTQLLQGGGGGESFPLLEGENVIGRESGQVCFLHDRYVSARHARIDITPAGMTICDLGSSNGTFLRITRPTLIGAGDHVLIGMQLLKVEG